MTTRIQIPDDMRYRFLKLIEARPSLTQREAAEELGISVGKANYCLQALVRKGWIKARNFKNSRHKIGYMYILTPKGIEEKLRVTYRFLDRKMQEYEDLAQELEVLMAEVNELKKANGESEVPAFVPRRITE